MEYIFYILQKEITVRIKYRFQIIKTFYPYGWVNNVKREIIQNCIVFDFFLPVDCYEGDRNILISDFNGATYTK